MQTVTQQFREQEYSGEALFNCILRINDNLVPVEQIAKITIKSPIIDTSTETFYVGTFISQSVTIKFKNLDGLNIQSKDLVHLEIGQSVDEVYTYLPMGEYIVDDLAENYYTTCEITCLDYAVKFKPNIDYSPCFTDGKADVNTIIQFICDSCGVELGSDLSLLPNSNVEVGTYDSTISGKQWLSYLAEIKGCNLKMSRDGKLLFIPFVRDEEDVEINALKSAEWELGEKYQLSKIVYFDAIRNFTKGNDNGNILFIRQDNPFITDESVINNLANQMLFNAQTTEQLKSITVNDANSSATSKIQLYGDIYQEGTPTPSNPQNIDVVTGSNIIHISDGENEKTFTIDLGSLELCKIGEYQDYIYKNDNKWYVHKEIGKITFDGSERWNFDSSSLANVNRFRMWSGEIIFTSLTSSSNAITNQLPILNNYSSTTEHYYSLTDNLGTNYFIFYNKTIAPDLDTFKDYLNGHNLIVYGSLKNTTTTEITDATLISQLEAIYNFNLYDNINIISTNSSNLEPYLKLTYGTSKNFTIWSLKNKNYGDISLDAWDIIKFNLGDEHYLTYNDNTLTYELNIMTNISTQIPTKQKEVTTNVVGGDMETNIKMLKTTLDYVKNQISLLVSETSGLTEQTNQLVMDILSTQNIFQITGGVNLINNSQFLFEDLNSEYWSFTNNGSNPYNNIGNGYDANLIGKTTAVAKIKLRDTIAQTTTENIVNLLENQQYTLNYSYTQDNLTSTTVQLIENISGNVIFEKTYNNQVSNITNETFTFIAEETAYTFKITTSTVSGDTSIGYFNMYDLMLNSGDKRTWTPAKSEVYSTVVKMSQMGLSVFATGSNIVTLLTSQGFQVRKYANGQIGLIITEFTDTGIITGDIESDSISTGKYISTEMMINGVEHHVEYFKE